MGGLHGSLVFCLGGNGEVATDFATSACEHEHVPGPSPSRDHEHDEFCCDDIELTVAEVLALPGFDDAPAFVSTAALPPTFGFECINIGAPRGPPPRADAATAHRLAIVSSTRLTL